MFGDIMMYLHQIVGCNFLKFLSDFQKCVIFEDFRIFVLVLGNSCKLSRFSVFQTLVKRKDGSVPYSEYSRLLCTLYTAFHYVSIFRTINFLSMLVRHILNPLFEGSQITMPVLNLQLTKKLRT